MFLPAAMRLSVLVAVFVVLVLAVCSSSVSASSQLGVGSVTPALGGVLGQGRRERPLESIEWSAGKEESEEDGLALHAYTTGAAGTPLSQLVPFARGVSVRALLRSNLLADLLLDRGMGSAVQCQCEMIIRRSTSSRAKVVQPSADLLAVLQQSEQAEVLCRSAVNGRTASWALVQFDHEQIEKLDPNAVHSLLKSSREASGELAPYPLTSAELLAENWEGVAGWVKSFIDNHWGPMHPYPSYKDDVPGQTGRWHLNTGAVLQRGQAFDRRVDAASPVRIGVAADWAAGTLEADCVQSAMMASNGSSFDPHWTLHVGDIYYVGSEDEVKANCLGQAPVGVAKGVKWPHGSLGSLAVQGNHEAYARSYGFFDTFLPTLGARLHPNSSTLGGQGSGYAALENAFWRIILLDTGYNTYSLMPKLDNTNNTQPQAVIDWLRDDVGLGNASDTRGIVFFSHHQVRTAFGTAYTATPDQIADLLPPNRTVAWFFGHEHRAGWYNPFEYKRKDNGKSMNVHARCVGMGGFPATTAPLPANAAAMSLRAYDDRVYKTWTGFFDQPVTFNGFSRLTLDGPSLGVTYSTLTIDPATGVLSPSLRTDLVSEKFEVDFNGDIQLRGFKVLEPGITIVQKTVTE